MYIIKDNDVISILLRNIAFEKEVRAQLENELHTVMRKGIKDERLIYELVLINDVFIDEHARLKDTVSKLEHKNKILELRSRHNNKKALREEFTITAEVPKGIYYSKKAEIIKVSKEYHKTKQPRNQKPLK